MTIITFMPNTTTTSTAAHLATVLINPITTQHAIPRANMHNPVLVDADLIKTNIKNRFIIHNTLWPFAQPHVGDFAQLMTRMEELTIHSYDTRLKETRNIRSMKDIVLVDLQENNLHSLEAYIRATNAVEREQIIPIVADWPGQIHLRTAIFTLFMLSNITNN